MSEPHPPGVSVPLIEQLKALEEEIPLVCKRQDMRAEKGKIHYGTAAIRKRELKAALETFRALVKQGHVP